MNQVSKNYDLGERTSVYSENVIDFCRNLTLDGISEPIIKQLVRSATSIGANYMEAKNGSSKKDFKNKIHICKKEAQETEYWLRMLLKFYPSVRSNIEALSKESHELLLIFQRIVSTLQINDLKT
ncbi:MAG: four helix bundle protein [Candidatus Doudnabacteria bacterium]|nr:four helix bundle protein [Candidatus Doudnabacteria bacterium]